MNKIYHAPKAWISLYSGILLSVILLLSQGCSEQKPAEDPSLSGYYPVPTVAVPQRDPDSFLRGSAPMPEAPRSPEEILIGMTPDEQAKTILNSLVFALTAFRCHTGRYPTQEEGLRALLVPPSDIWDAGTWQGPYTSEQYLLDPWGEPFIYSWLDDDMLLFDIISLGADGIESEDDFRLSQMPKSVIFAQREHVDNFIRDYHAMLNEQEATGRSPSTPEGSLH